MSFATFVNASPKSFVSVNAVPPVSDASVVSVSCCAASCAELLRHAAPGERADAAAAALARAAAGHDGLQPARVDGIDRDVGADGGVDGGAQLHLVVGAAALHARS